MQNHMPYTNWYIDNEFVGADTSTGLSADEYQNLETYTKGLNLTDQATADAGGAAGAGRLPGAAAGRTAG